MSKALRLLTVLAMVALPLAFTPGANALSDCSTWSGGVNITGLGSGDQQCNVTLQVSVPLTTTITFTSVSTDFGTVLAGGTAQLNNAVTGTIAQNGGTVTLGEQICPVSANDTSWQGNGVQGNTSGSYFSQQMDARAFFSMNTGTTVAANQPGYVGPGCTATGWGAPGAARTYTTGGTFSDSFQVHVASNATVEAVSQTIHYEVWHS